MKNFLSIFSISCFILVGCQDKTTVPLPLPNATFTVEINDNNVAFFNFNLNEGEVYTLDFGDGSTYTDSLTASNMNKSPSIGHEYKTNGQFLTTLSIKSIAGTDKKQVSINANNAFIVDFSYEILENGRVKFKNLSKNTADYQWSISHYNASNSYPFYLSNKQDIDVIIDLVGNYLATLSAEKGSKKRSISKLVNIKLAKSQMTFNGLYEKKKVSGSLESQQLFYRYGFGSSSGALGTNFGLFQSINQVTNNNDSLQIQNSLQIKYYSLFPFDSIKQTASSSNQEERFLALKKYLTLVNDPSIIEVTEEDLDPLFYNNTDQFYPKAFWVRYKVKNEVLDGELKVRIMVYGVK